MPNINQKEFTSIYNTGNPQVVWKQLVADLETPVSAFLKIAEDNSNAFLLESVEGGQTKGRYSIIGMLPDLIWRCCNGKAELNRNALLDNNSFNPCNDSPIDSLRSILDESFINIPEFLPPMASGLVGYIGYDMVRYMEKLPNINSDELSVPEAILIRPTIMAIFDSVSDTITVITPVRHKPEIDAEKAYNIALEKLENTIANLECSIKTPDKPESDILELEEPRSNTTREKYFEMVNIAKDYIRSGDIFQVVPSQRFSVPFPLHPFALYRSLRRLNPSPFLYYLNFGEFSVVGSSPEILVRLRDGNITIRPIAGTRKRGRNRKEDKQLEDELINDKKELAEHLMLLDLGRNDIGRVSEVGSIKITDKMMVEYYSHVMHIVSNIIGRIRNNLTSLDALIAGFPAGTVTGAPKVRAMEIIDELENSKRGVYAGAIGYFSADGSMDTCIALRTAVVKDKIMYVQAGGGVVLDSEPEAEYNETVNKARALFRAAEEAIRFASKD